MGNFLQAWPIVEAKEDDVVTDDPNDKGGYSVYGISSVHWPHEKAILAARAAGLKDKDKVPPEIVTLCQQYYHREWWTKLRLDEVNDQDVCEKIFGTAINVGFGPAVKFAQEAAGVALTGSMNDETINALNS